MRQYNNSFSHRIINEYFSDLNAGQETSGLIGDVVKAIFDDPELENKDWHLSAILNSNVISPSVEYVKNLIKAVLSIDNFQSKQIELSSRKGQKIVAMAGSGKKGIKTVNISTPAAIVATSCGAQIVKPCSKSTSSLTGSSDFFTQSGGHLNDTQQMCDTFYRTGIGFFSIEGMIPKFDSLYGGKALTPTALSYALPAIVNPIKTDTVLYGLSLPNIKTSIHALHDLGYENAIVANTSDDNRKFIDEIGVFRFNNMVFGQMSEDKDEVRAGDSVKIMKLLTRYSVDQVLQKKSAAENVRACINTLKGKGDDAHKEIVAVNAGAAIYLANLVENFREGYLLAINELNSGRPFDKLKEVIAVSGGSYIE